MRFIIDTNRIIAALVKNGFSRKLILYAPFEFVAPEFTLVEITKYQDEIISKADITKEEFHVLLTLLLEKIAVISQPKYESGMDEAGRLLGKIDVKDVPFLAVALTMKNDGIWSEDAHFEKQNKVKVWKTKELADSFLNQN